MTNISFQAFNWADIAIVGIILVSTIISLMRGFVREAVSLATWIIAVWIAIRFAPLLTDFLSNYIATPSVRTAVAFGGLFLVILIIGSLVNILFSQLVERTGLTGTDRLVGLIFGFARGVLLIGILILLGNFMELTKDPWWQASQLIPHFKPVADWLQSFIPQQINHLSQAFNQSG